MIKGEKCFENKREKYQKTALTYSWYIVYEKQMRSR